MGAIADLWSSERGLVAVALIVAATVLTTLKVFTTDQWVTYTEWIFVTYTASKTVTGSVAVWRSSGTTDKPSPAQAETTSPWRTENSPAASTAGTASTRDPNPGKTP